MRTNAPLSQTPLAEAPTTFVAVSRSATRSFFRVALLISLSVAGCFLGYAFFTGAPLTPVMMALTVVVCMLVALAIPWKVIIRVGSDGVSLRNASFPSSRFIACSRLARVDVDRNHVWLALNDGKRIGLSFPRKREHIAGELAARITKVMADFRSIEHPFAAVLGRGARSAEDWRRALGGRAPDAAYRELAIPPASLIATIEDGEAPADIRLGAAIALRRVGLDEIGRARVRVAAQLTRDPKLRVGLVKTADSDDEDLARAVDLFCDEKTARRETAHREEPAPKRR